jgi:hypothetical protein
LFFAATLIFTGLMLYSNWLVSKMSADEKKKIELWADAIQQKAILVNYTNDYFDKVIAEEKRRALLLAKSYNKLLSNPKRTSPFTWKSSPTTKPFPASSPTKAEKSTAP